uniref:testis-expressed protein 36 n=1 Tax=Oncorhynchus gorbuscha TaxID=8017 RepID=UPI001EAED327|nr:testis-expressed protein 36 [Oncorhynchus gorbuscha]
MTKGGKKYSSMEKDGKWLAHAGLPANDTSKRETCTSTGYMMSQSEPLPPASSTEKYPKIFINTEQKTMGRVYPFSAHDNQAALQDTITVFDDGLGRKKCLDERRQHNSHFCLCHHGSVSGVGETRGDFSAYQTDYQDHQDTEGSSTSRRFPINHLDRSTVAAVAQAGEHFMWFGRHDEDRPVPLEVLAATNCSSSSKPSRHSYHIRH